MSQPLGASPRRCEHHLRAAPDVCACVARSSPPASVQTSRKRRARLPAARCDSRAARPVSRTPAHPAITSPAEIPRARELSATGPKSDARGRARCRSPGVATSRRRPRCPCPRHSIHHPSRSPLPSGSTYVDVDPAGYHSDRARRAGRLLSNGGSHQRQLPVGRVILTGAVPGSSGCFTDQWRHALLLRHLVHTRSTYVSPRT